MPLKKKKKSNKNQFKFPFDWIRFPFTSIKPLMKKTCFNSGLSLTKQTVTPLALYSVSKSMKVSTAVASILAMCFISIISAESGISDFCSIFQSKVLMPGAL